MPIKNQNFHRIYLDYAATTLLDPRVFQAMRPYFSEKFGNTMSLHFLGQEAKEALEQSRAQVAQIIKAEPEEIIFTSSATESNNTVLKGLALSNQSPFNSLKDKHFIISSIEHPCIMESAKWLESQGLKVTRLKVDKYGLINPNDVRKAIRKETVLVSIIHASNEIGTIEPIDQIAKIINQKNKQLKKRIYFHVDAAQTFGKIFIDLSKTKIDLLTASSHKMYGPKGIGLLFVRKGVELTPLLHGGGQEKGLRSSTLNLPAIVGFAKACQIAAKQMEQENRKLIKLRDKLIKGVLERIPGSYLNGHPTKRLANNVNLRFDFVEGESIVMRLDLMGIAASTGSACSSAKLEPSHVLLAIGLRHEQAHGSLRLTLGRWTREKEINYLLKVLPGTIKRLREISPFTKSHL